MPRRSIIKPPPRKNPKGGKQFKKGEKVDKRPRGRPPGVGNRIPTLLKDCILRAAEIVGENGRGKGGLTGYLARLARKEPKSFAGLLGRVIPLHITGDINHNHRVFETREEIIEQLKARGIPIERIFPDAVPPPRQLPPPLKVVGSNKP